MKYLMIMLSWGVLVNNQPSKEQFESITGTKVVVQGKVPVVAKKVTTKNAQKKKKTVQKKKKTIKKSTKKVQKKKVVKKKIYKSKKAKKTTYNFRYNVGEIQRYAHNLVRQYGWSEEDYQALVLLWNRESSWDPYAVNGNACGIPQAKPCSKMAKFGRDYRTNWKVQVRWGLDYIKEVYTTPSEAYRKFLGRKPHWY